MFHIFFGICFLQLNDIVGFGLFLLSLFVSDFGFVFAWVHIYKPFVVGVRRVVTTFDRTGN